MAPTMSTVERLKVKNEVNRILKKQSSSITQRTILQKFGIYNNCHGSGSVSLDFDECEDSVLLQLRKELRNLVVGSNVCKDDDDAEKKKVLRVAMLKTRFAETIKKANGGKSDDQWEKLKKQRREEEAKIKQELIRKQKIEKEDYELKKRKRETEDDELKKRRRQEQINEARKAARMALELVEKNVAVVDNFKVMKEFEMLINGTACF